MNENGQDLYFIIGGGGQVGYFLARHLFNSGYEVVLLERDARRIREMEDELDQVVVRGDACEARTLESIGCDRADYMVAVTGDDEDNLVMCQVARHLSANRIKTIARVNNIENIPLFQELGIDEIISLTDKIMDVLQTTFQLPLNRAT